MKTLKIVGMLIVLSQLFISCEDLIDVDLNAAEQRIVIEANLHNLGVGHVIHVSRTVPFGDNRPNEIITDADVRVITGGGTTHRFTYSEADRGYVNRSLMIRENRTYDLRVEVDGELFEGTETMPTLVPIDSVGMMREALFGDTFYFATLRFRDPAQTDNFYKYNVSVDGEPMRFFAVFNDKFNNGQNVTHQIGSVNNDITENSVVTVRRYCVSAAVFRYWNELQSTNPGSAAPANPTSNISNGALGYFGVSAAEDFRFDFSVYQENSAADEEL